MCDVRLFRSARMDFETALILWQTPHNDEMILNNAAYHLQQAVEKTLKGALECVGVTVPNTHKITKLICMAADHGANLTITEWMDEHSEMLGEWEAQTRYNMDFLVEKRKLDRALVEIRDFLEINGITENLRRELRDASARERLLQCLPKERRNCNDFELNCYYIMFQKRIV